MSMITGRARAAFPKQVHGRRPETSTTEPGSRQAECGLMDPGKSGSNTHALFNRGTHGETVLALLAMRFSSNTEEGLPAIP